MIVAEQEGIAGVGVTHVGEAGYLERGDSTLEKVGAIRAGDVESIETEVAEGQVGALCVDSLTRVPHIGIQQHIGVDGIAAAYTDALDSGKRVAQLPAVGGVTFRGPQRRRIEDETLREAIFAEDHELLRGRIVDLAVEVIAIKLGCVIRDVVVDRGEASRVHKSLCRDALKQN